MKTLICFKKLFYCGKLALVLSLSLLCVLHPRIINAQNNTPITSVNYDISASVLYDNVCMHIINIHPNSAYSTFFSGLARAQHLFGYKEEPVNPRTNKSEVNINIVPLRGTFKTIISSNECVTFTGDWNASEKTGNGLLSYVNTLSPEFNFTYEGTIWKGYPHGLGIWQGDGFRYVGWFYKGEKFGYGTMSYYDGREEQGFVTSFGDIVHESMVSDAMKEDFNEKVNNISKLKYQVLDE